MKHAIKFFMIAAVTAFSTLSYSQSDAIQKYFDKYMNDERFDMVFISPKMFEVVSKIELEGDNVDPEIMEIIKELKGLRVLSYDGPEAMTYYNEAKEKINLNEYEELVVARDGDENVHIRVKESGDIVSELLLLVGGKDEFALLSFVGNVDLKKVGKLGKLLDIEHVDQLEKIDKKN
ncbi:MAG TPA: DUF4252 domain-containing protein [Saprospiraceae bacterium]|nr:DUF4252 domain-containing protein [Saprospiraceae bacterium]